MKILRFLPILLLFNCDVKFNSNLKEYIDNVSERKPLVFEVDGSEKIDEKLSFNMGFNVNSKTSDLIITNKEKFVIRLKSFSGVEGDFTIESIPARGIKPEESITVSVTYNPGFSINETVQSDFVLVDERDRSFTLTLMGSSRSQPLDISISNEIIDKYDFGTFSGENETVAFTLENNGLVEINILSIEPPSGVVLTSEGTFTIPIGGKEDFLLYYENQDIPLDDYVRIFSDFSREGIYDFPLYGGKVLDIRVEELDVDGNIIASVSSNYNYGVILSGTSEADRTKKFRVTNASVFDMNLSGSLSTEDDFLLDFSTVVLKPGESHEFIIVFHPDLNTPSNATCTFTISDQESRRYSDITIAADFL